MIVFLIFQNLSIAIVGKGKSFTIHEDDSVSTFLELIAGDQPASEAEEPPAGMETD
jgi:hypothetical protein